MLIFHLVNLTDLALRDFLPLHTNSLFGKLSCNRLVYLQIIALGTNLDLYKSFRTFKSLKSVPVRSPYSVKRGCEQIVLQTSKGAAQKFSVTCFHHNLHCLSRGKLRGSMCPIQYRIFRFTRLFGSDS